MSIVEFRIAAIINRLSDKELMEFKVGYLGMPEEIAKHPFFAATNISRWVFVVNRYQEYVRRMLARSGSSHSDDSSPPGLWTIPPFSDDDINNSQPRPAGSKRKLDSEDEKDNTQGAKDDTQGAEGPTEPRVFLGFIELSDSDDNKAAGNTGAPQRKKVRPVKMSAYRKPKNVAPVKKDPTPPPREHIDKSGRCVIDFTSP